MCFSVQDLGHFANSSSLLSIVEANNGWKDLDRHQEETLTCNRREDWKKK